MQMKRIVIKKPETEGINQESKKETRANQDSMQFNSPMEVPKKPLQN